MSSSRQWGLPLFTKELLELAARRRTYIIRVVYVSCLFYFVMTTLSVHLQTANPLNVLGQGLPILTSMVGFEFTGIYLFLPAMACGVFTIEKERNTLALLFLTRLGPWTIIVEKLLSRMLPMLMFLCCALPVMAFTYSMGGLTLNQLFCAGYYLFLAAFQTACVAVMCSALAHSTASAFIQTYVALLFINYGPRAVLAFFPRGWINSGLEAVLTWMNYLVGSASPFQGLPGYFTWGIHQDIPMMVLSPSSMYSSMAVPLGGWGGTTPWPVAFLFGIPSFLSGLACLLVARWALYRRAFVLASNPLLSFFRGIDKVFFWLNRNVKFDVKLVRESDSLPDNEPIAWREVSKRSLGQFRYLVRIMVPLMFPVIFVGMFMATSSANDWNRYGRNAGLTPLVLFLGATCLGLVIVTAANAIPLERTRQTWDVLRSMPLTGREMLQQKLRGVRRLQWVCSIPLIGAILLQAWWRYQLLYAGLTSEQVSLRMASRNVPDANFLWWEYLIGALACVWIYTEQVKWISLWCGLMIRNSMRAILTSGLLVAAACTVPYVIGLYLFVWLVPSTDEWPLPANSLLALLYQVCPVAFTALNETGDLRAYASIPLIPAFIQISTQCTLLWLIRGHILKRAEWYLDRIGKPNQRRTRNDRAADPAISLNETSASAATPVVGAAS